MLHYNENKVAAGEARLLLASGFGGDASGYSFAQKLQRFEHLTMLNSRVRTNAVHITLNFDPQDKLDNGTLQQISMAYMERIGFGDQPFLVYRHYDAAHTHIHIATVNIRADGGRIDTHGIGWRLSEPARIGLEKEYDLVVAKGRNQSNGLSIRPAAIEKAVYGRTPTKRAITNIVNAVVGSYRFGSLAEFNAVLQQFNVRADRGAEGSLMHDNKGLIYSLINAMGEPVGVPVKASAIYGKPTLPELEKHFAGNREKKLPYKEALKNTIDGVFAHCRELSRATFIQELTSRQVAVLLRTNEQGLTYGLTFIDHANKTVFNGSDLGRAYSAKGLLQRLGNKDELLTREQVKSVGTEAARPKQQVYLPQPGQTNYLQLALIKSLPESLPSIPKQKKRRKKGRQTEQEQNQPISS